MGVRVSQVKPSNCFRLHSTPMISKHSNSYRAHLWFCDFSQQSRFLTACRCFEKLVLPPSIFDLRLLSLMIRNLQSYPTTVLHERLWHFRGGGQNILWPLLHIFRGWSESATPRIYAPSIAEEKRGKFEMNLRPWSAPRQWNRWSRRQPVTPARQPAPDCAETAAETARSPGCCRTDARCLPRTGTSHLSAAPDTTRSDSWCPVKQLQLMHWQSRKALGRASTSTKNIQRSQSESTYTVNLRLIVF